MPSAEVRTVAGRNVGRVNAAASPSRRGRGTLRMSAKLVTRRRYAQARICSTRYAGSPRAASHARRWRGVRSAGAVIAAARGTAADKIKAFESAGVRVAQSPAELGSTMAAALKERKQ